MGCCINYFIGFENAAVLDEVLVAIARQAEAIGFEVGEIGAASDRRTLSIKPHADCDVLRLDFRKVSDWASSDEFLFLGREVKEADWSRWDSPHCAFLKPNLWYCAGFVKTEYAPKSAHAKLCELLRLIAPRASLFCVRDEANFYETRGKSDLAQGHGYLAGDRVNDLP